MNQLEEVKLFEMLQEILDELRRVSEKTEDIYQGNFNDRLSFIDSAKDLLEAVIQTSVEESRASLYSGIQTQTSIGRAQLKRHIELIERKVPRRKFKIFTDTPWYLVLVNKRDTERYNLIQANFPDYASAVRQIVQSYAVEITASKLFKDNNITNKKVNELIDFYKHVTNGFISDDGLILNLDARNSLLETIGKTVPQIELLSGFSESIVMEAKKVSTKTRTWKISIRTQTKTEWIVGKVSSGLKISIPVVKYAGCLAAFAALGFIIWAIGHPLDAGGMVRDRTN